MINQIPSTKVNRKSAYADFANSKNQYYLPEKIKNDEYAPIDSVKDKKNNRKKWIIFSSVAAGMLFVLAVVSGLRNGLFKLMEKYKGSITQTVNKKNAGAKSQEKRLFYGFLSNGLNKFIEKAEALNNFHSLKIILTKKLMCAFSTSKMTNFLAKILRFIYNKTTSLFEKVSRNTVISSYKKTRKRLSKIIDYSKKVNSKLKSTNSRQLYTIDGVTKTKKEWLADIEQKFSAIKSIYSLNFTGKALSDRYKRIKSLMSDLDVRFWDASLNPKKLKDNFTSKDMYQTFLAQNLVAEDRSRLINEVSHLRSGITNDIKDIYSNIKMSLSDIENSINPRDFRSIDRINNLKIHLKEYANLSGNNEIINRERLTKTLHRDFELIKNSITEAKNIYKKDDTEDIIKRLGNASDMLSRTEKGEIQKILTIYKELLPRNDYINIKNKLCKYNKSLYKSINIECASFFDKMRDLSMGSAPVEAADIIFGVAPLSYFLLKEHDNDKRISIGLKYGIPVVSTLGTIIYCTTSLLSGGKAMAFGMITGYLTHAVCKFVDKERLEHKALNKQE